MLKKNSWSVLGYSFDFKSLHFDHTCFHYRPHPWDWNVFKDTWQGKRARRILELIFKEAKSWDAMQRNSNRSQQQSTQICPPHEREEFSLIHRGVFFLAHRARCQLLREILHLCQSNYFKLTWVWSKAEAERYLLFTLADTQRICNVDLFHWLNAALDNTNTLSVTRNNSDYLELLILYSLLKYLHIVFYHLLHHRCLTVILSYNWGYLHPQLKALIRMQNKLKQLCPPLNSAPCG